MTKIAFFPGSFKPPHIGHYTIVKNILPKVSQLFIIISPKARGHISSKDSLSIWNKYLSPSQKSKVTFIIANSSPIMEIFHILRTQKFKCTDTIYLIKSSKNSNNGRFDMFRRLKYNIIEETIPKFQTISSTNMRAGLETHDYDLVEPFFPKHLSDANKHKIYRSLTK